VTEAPVEKRLAVLVDLSPTGRPMALRLPDLLFCASTEVSQEELVRRRGFIWDSLLKPVTLQVCVKRELSQADQDTLLYVWAATEGPPRLKTDARGEYRNEMNTAINKCMTSFGDELRGVHVHTAQDKDMKSLVQLRNLNHIQFEDMHHGSFQGVPGWAIICDLSMAAKDLERLRVLHDASSFCDLMERGHLDCSLHPDLLDMSGGRYQCFSKHHRGRPGFVNRLMARRLNSVAKKSGLGLDRAATRKTQARKTQASRVSVASANGFRESSDENANSGRHDTSLEFWMGLVTLWLLALHMYSKTKFLRGMKEIARDGELVECHIQNFESVMTWARAHIADAGLKKWSERVLAPLWAIDILGCSFEAASAERVLAIETALAAKFPVVSRENCYDGDEDEGECRHHKFVLLVQSQFTSLGNISLLVEVDVFLVAYAAVNKRVSLLRSATSGRMSVAH